MNELQQVLLVIAVLVIIGLYFLSRSRQVSSQKEKDKKHSSSLPHSVESEHKQKATQALNELGEPHIPVSKVTEARIAKQVLSTDDVESIRVENHNQEELPFGDEFKVPSHTEHPGQEAQNAEKVNEFMSDKHLDAEIQKEKEEQLVVGKNALGGKHHVLEVDDLDIALKDERYEAQGTPTFGVPEDKIQVTESQGEKKEPQIFVILVMSTGQAFSMREINHALLGVGLTFNKNQIYVKCDNMNNTIIKVANLMEPGTFPVDDVEHYTTCGVAMILELPCSVKAPAAMHDLIMMARKISQRLQGRLYNMERQLLKESDLQSMRDEAVKYESEPL